MDPDSLGDEDIKFRPNRRRKNDIVCYKDNGQWKIDNGYWTMDAYGQKSDKGKKMTLFVIDKIKDFKYITILLSKPNY